MNHKITKTVEVEMELSPEQCARMFALSDSQYQRMFLNELGRLAASQGTAENIPAGWWCRQCRYIGSEAEPAKISAEAKSAVATLHDYLCNPSTAEAR